MDIRQKKKKTETSENLKSHQYAKLEYTVKYRDNAQTVGFVTTCQTVTFMYSYIKESQEFHLDPEHLKSLLNLYYFFFIFLQH